MYILNSDNLIKKIIPSKKNYINTPAIKLIKLYKTTIRSKYDIPFIAM
ncbi:hypothetical protein ADIARSV_0284 [Arcticibacter svalbardensis MN12-7]|uniref:Uncharacterized protein n=1 Tax=Arcticibacter svalbardensis MN12-7 TaxID=1150600 RepID=R9GYB9_9SPHI|nr:hypothetical protein ADIARSV_0284 [Arcticibacter svalbardensis MN12-7]